MKRCGCSHRWDDETASWVRVRETGERRRERGKGNRGRGEEEIGGKDERG